MNIKMTRLALLASTIVTLSACAPMTPQPQQPPYTPPPVTNPNPNPGPVTPPVTNPNPNPVPQQQYVVQLTASASQAKAEGIKSTFGGKGYNAFISPLMVDGRLLHRVQIGYYTDKNAAEMALNQLRQQNPNDAYVANAIVKTP